MGEKHELVERAEAEIENVEALIERSIQQKRDIDECIKALNTLERDIQNTEANTDDNQAA